MLLSYFWSMNAAYPLNVLNVAFTGPVRLRYSVQTQSRKHGRKASARHLGPRGHIKSRKFHGLINLPILPCLLCLPRLVHVQKLSLFRRGLPNVPQSYLINGYLQLYANTVGRSQPNRDAAVGRERMAESATSPTGTLVTRTVLGSIGVVQNA